LLPLWRKLVPAWIILGAGSLAFVPILINGFPRGADVEHHYRWSFFFFNALKAGYLYPRWLTDLNHGYGSPVAVYYPPLTFYVSAFFNLISGDTLIALSLSCWLGMVLSGYAMYRFSRNLLSSRLSLLAALFYMLAPYHIFDLYRGNSISEYWSLVWIPLILDSIYKIASTESWREVPRLAILYGLLLLTNVPISLELTLIIPVFVLILTRKRAALGRVCCGAALGAACPQASAPSKTHSVHLLPITLILQD